LSASFPWLIAGFGICVATVGALIWFVPYREYIHNAYPYEPLAVLAGVALLLSWLIGTRFLSTAFAVACSYPAATLLRIVMDSLGHPTGHNLWPFEISMSAALGIFAAVPATAIGRTLRYLTHGKDSPLPPSPW
jgi:hypothetical protein